MSSPHAAAVAALLESCNPALTGPDKFSLMVNNVTSYSDSRDLGSGILNAKLALDAVGDARRRFAFLIVVTQVPPRAAGLS